MTDETDEASGLFNRDETVDWPVPRLFAEYGRDHKRLIAIALLASAITPIASLLPTYLLQIAIDAVLLGREPFTLPGVPTAQLPGDQFDQLVLVVGIIGAAATLSVLADLVGGWAWGRFSQSVQHAVRTDTYEHLQSFGIDFFEKQPTGQLQSVINNDVNELNDLLERFLGDLLQMGLQIVGIAGFLFLLHWQFALVALVSVPIMAAMSWGYVTRIKPKYETVRQLIGTLNARIENTLGGMKLVKTYTAEDYEAARITAASDDVRDARWDVISNRVAFFPAISFVNWVSFCVLALVGGIWHLSGPPLFFTEPLSVGTLAAVLMYNQQFTQPLVQAGSLLDRYYDARASVVRVLSLRDHESSLMFEERSADAATVADGNLPLCGTAAPDDEPPAIEGRVSVEDVRFSYESDEDPTLVDIGFEVEPGSFVGIVGPTGSGKTTLIKLLLRFYDPNDGVVRIDGHDLRDLDPQHFRATIGAVSQDPYLFTGTVRENIAYGRPDANDAAIEEAARVANAHEFVADLPAEYDTQVGERGVRLSGGQRQRIAIARAVLTDPQLLILDEATSHVDNETEALIQRSLDDVVADRTTFAVAHSLSTVRRADTILVLDDGELVERGTHEGLLERDGLYADLWRVQTGQIAELPESFLERGGAEPVPRN